MSNHSPRSTEKECSDCVKKHNRGRRSAKEPKYCPKHQCPVKYSDDIICTKRKKAAENRCLMHTTCLLGNCTRPRTLDEAQVPNDYCFEHSCVAPGCNEGKLYHPNHGTYTDLCALHELKKCTRPSCPGWHIDNGSFCVSHTCQVDSCSSGIVDNRPFCEMHNTCIVPNCQAERCQFGDKFEEVCSSHYVPTCRRCPQKSSPPSKFCDLHSCRYKGCAADALPVEGKPYCTDHECQDDGCQSLRRLTDNNGKLRLNNYCPFHECQFERCVNHIAPEKSHCASHCCTKDGCDDARDKDPRFGTLCLLHYERQIRQDAYDRATQMQREAELAAQYKEQTQAHAAEERRRRAQVDELRRRQTRRRQAGGDGERTTFYDDFDQGMPPRSRHRTSYHEANYEDEGYRSNRNSGSHSQHQSRHSGEQRWQEPGW